MADFRCDACFVDARCEECRAKRRAARARQAASRRERRPVVELQLHPERRAKFVHALAELLADNILKDAAECAECAGLPNGARCAACFAKAARRA